MSEYKDRGIIKWAPFDALTGHGTMLEEMIYNINKKQKASLSVDQYEEINATIQKALNSNKEISIVYFSDGYEYTTFGRIKKIDTIEKIITLDTEEKIDFDSILEIKIIR